MNCKNYTEKDILTNNYVIIEHDAEEPITLIVSMHKEKDKAEKRLKHLKKEAERLFNKDISLVEYELVESNDDRVIKCYNYEREDE